MDETKSVHASKRKETQGVDKFRFTNLVMVFFLGAFLGWLWEGVFAWARSGEWYDAGFLHGPWLPVYGVGCAVIYLLKKVFGKNVFMLFLCSAVACAVIEYFTGWALEKVYHRRWWNYSRLPWNLHGRIFFGGVLFFGIGGTLVAYLVFPFFEKLLNKLPRALTAISVLLLIGLFVADCAVSIFVTHAA